MDDKPDTIMLYEGYRIVFPSGPQQKILCLLHLHQMGLVKTKRAATMRYYFAGMTGRIDQMVEGCSTCQLFEASQSVESPLQPVFRSERTAMERVGVDIYHFGNLEDQVLQTRLSSRQASGSTHSGTRSTCVTTVGQSSGPDSLSTSNRWE